MTSHPPGSTPRPARSSAHPAGRRRVRLAALLSVALSVVGCTATLEPVGDLAPGGELDPCAGVTCSARGSCVPSGGAAACACDPGYQADGLDCLPGCVTETDVAFCARLGRDCGSVAATDNCGDSRTVASCGTCAAPERCGVGGAPNLCAVDPCAGVTCSGHGTCRASGGAAACACDTGYRPSGLSCLSGCTSETDAAFCGRLGKDCGSVAGADNCGVPRSVASCGACAGTERCGGGGTTNVCGADACAGVTCSGHGTCQEAGGVASCACQAGYRASGLDCLATSATRVTVVMAGDIAQSGRTAYARAAAALVTAHTPRVEAVVLAGDNARYGNSGGLLAYYDAYYRPADQANWGQFDAISFPSAGNHEYYESKAQGYYDYFSARLAAIAALPTYHGHATDGATGYYSFDLNGWHFLVLNSNCSAVTGGCGAGSPQQAWLRADLAAHAAMPTIAVWHSPRYACGGSHGDDTAMQPIWADLVAAGVDLVFNGHNHYYQRWKPLDAATPGVVDTARGLTEVVVGSGGVSTYNPCAPADARIAAQKGGDASVGVFFLTLGSDGAYAFEYRLTSDGSAFDSGSGRSHHAP